MSACFFWGGAAGLGLPAARQYGGLDYQPCDAGRLVFKEHGFQDQGCAQG